MNAPDSEILIYQPEDGRTRIDVRLEDETVWLSQRLLAELFQVSVPTINEHIQNVYKEKELEPDPTIRNFRIVQSEGRREVTREVAHYNLEMIIAIGYRVRSHRGTQFRRWATERLREYLVKGFALDDERLKEGRNLGADYFDELLDRIRDIRASEKRFYRKVQDIYALSVDYAPDSDRAKLFFQTVQNKLHWAAHGHTAAELIAERSDAERPNMGLTSWKGKKVRKGDVATAKNYLSEDELRGLNRIVTMYLDYAEDQAQRQQAMHMADWEEKLNAFLQFNGRVVLDHAGAITASLAKERAESEYERFRQRRLQDEDALDEDDAFGRETEQLSKDRQERQ
ncbi:MAG: hydroxyacid dehydrogenase [Candidatus Hydrogenedens sp.]|nr:hydroxyacid dehydrogenase [Candidatus Hydrogenedens sp.]